LGEMYSVLFYGKKCILKEAEPNSILMQVYNDFVRLSKKIIIS